MTKEWDLWQQLIACNAAKYAKEGIAGIKRSPLVHLGRAIEVGCAWGTEIRLQRDEADNTLLLSKRFDESNLFIPPSSINS